MLVLRYGHGPPCRHDHIFRSPDPDNSTSVNFDPGTFLCTESTLYKLQTYSRCFLSRISLKESLQMPDDVMMWWCRVRCCRAAIKISATWIYCWKVTVLNLDIPWWAKTKSGSFKDKIMWTEPGQDPMASDNNTSKYIGCNQTLQDLIFYLFCSVLHRVA